MHIVAVGDSLTSGAGDRVLGGYVTRVADELRDENSRVSVANLAIGGATTGDLLVRVQRREVQVQLAAADVVLLSIGGNDLARAVPMDLRLSAHAAGFERALGAVTSRLRSILNSIRAANPSAELRVLGLYNPLVLPAREDRAAKSILGGWNAALEHATRDARGTFIPLADLFVARTDRLASDHFHPGPSGYEQISRRVVATLVPKAGRAAQR
jgi:lysophospholipase L1-like esterase